MVSVNGGRAGETGRCGTDDARVVRPVEARDRGDAVGAARSSCEADRIPARDLAHTVQDHLRAIYANLEPWRRKQSGRLDPSGITRLIGHWSRWLARRTASSRRAPRPNSRDDRSLAGSGSGRPYERFEILGKRIGLFGQPGTRARSQSPVAGLLTLAGLLTPDST